MRKVLGQMDMTAANNQENIQKKLEKLEKKLLESDRQFIKLYEDFTSSLCQNSSSGCCPPILNRKRKKQPKKLKN